MEKPSEHIKKKILEIKNSDFELKNTIEKQDNEAGIALCAVAIQAILDYLDSTHEG